MNTDKIFDNPLTGLIAVGTIAAVVIYFLGKKVVTDTAAAVSEVNAGTPYEGFGVVGTLGNATNAVSGGLLSDLGSSIGVHIYDWTHPGAGTPNSGTIAGHDLSQYD